MTAKSEASKAIDKAFRAALLLTGNTELAENAVLDGIAASEFGHIVDDVLLETVKSAIQRRAAFSDQSAQAPSDLPLELRRLFLLAPISRDSFVLRVLLGMLLRPAPGFYVSGSTSSKTCCALPCESCRSSKLTAQFGAKLSIPLRHRTRRLLAELLRLKNALIQKELEMKLITIVLFTATAAYAQPGALQTPVTDAEKNRRALLQ
jgi:hypothetical protein